MPLHIFNAWSDEGWVNDGAAVRVSLVCFSAVNSADSGVQALTLDGQAVVAIHADLTAGDGLNLTQAKPLKANAGASFQGSQKIGPFDIEGNLARQWCGRPNPNGKPNSDVLKPSWNGIDVTRRPRDGWIVDFGTKMSEGDAALYEAPFEFVQQYVKPDRKNNTDRIVAVHWWLHGRPRIAMRAALTALPRYFVTAEVSKHRFFVWLDSSVLPDKRLIVFSRSDDTNFGILHSRIHELWSLRLGSTLEDRPCYRPTTSFETFPFPAGLTPADTAHQQTEPVEGGALIPAQLREQASGAGLVRMSGAILKSEAYEPPASEPAPPGKRMQTANASTSSARTAEMSVRQAAIDIAKAAKKLNDLRENWLNPPEWTHKVPEVTPLGMDKSPYPDRIEPKPGISEVDLKALHKRTLTNLYNAKPAWLSMAHQQLDQAVAAAYGWTDYTSAMPDDEMLKRLLALNLARSAIIFGTTHPQTP
jgi:hypothetical protein